MKKTMKKIVYLLRGYNPYFLYWFDLLTERHIKNRKGSCIDCCNCCKHDDWHCEHIDAVKKRCLIYKNRWCNEWFPVSPKELKFMESIKPGLECKFYWDYKSKL
jgi:hypothetical protein